jgi:hypothetical protein
MEARHRAGHSVQRQRLARQPDELQAPECLQPYEITTVRFQLGSP